MLFLTKIEQKLHLMLNKNKISMLEDFPIIIDSQNLDRVGGGGGGGGGQGGCERRIGVFVKIQKKNGGGRGRGGGGQGDVIEELKFLGKFTQTNSGGDSVGGGGGGGVRVGGSGWM